MARGIPTTTSGAGGLARRLKALETQALAGVQQNQVNSMATPTQALDASRTAFEAQTRMANLERRMIEAQASRAADQQSVMAAAAADQTANRASMFDAQLKASEPDWADEMLRGATFAAGVSHLATRVADAGAKKDEFGNTALTVDKDGNPVRDMKDNALGKFAGILRKGLDQIPFFGSADLEHLKEIQQDTMTRRDIVADRQSRQQLAKEQQEFFEKASGYLNDLAKAAAGVGVGKQRELGLTEQQIATLKMALWGAMPGIQASDGSDAVDGYFSARPNFSESEGGLVLANPLPGAFGPGWRSMRPSPKSDEYGVVGGRADKPDTTGGRVYFPRNPNIVAKVGDKSFSEAMAANRAAFDKVYDDLEASELLPPGFGAGLERAISNYGSFISDAAAEYGVDPKMILAKMAIESGGNPSALSEQGAQGLMQILASTYKGLGPEGNGYVGGQRGDIWDPEENIRAGAALMAENARGREDDIELQASIWYWGFERTLVDAGGREYKVSVDDALNTPRRHDTEDLHKHLDRFLEVYDIIDESGIWELVSSGYSGSVQ